MVVMVMVALVEPSAEQRYQGWCQSMCGSGGSYGGGGGGGGGPSAEQRCQGQCWAMCDGVVVVVVMVIVIMVVGLLQNSFFRVSGWQDVVGWWWRW